jgi:DNA (cytosine-5)-methyltransferase 1
MNYYNDNDPKTAAWLRELIAAKEVPDGYVDERPIQSVQASELRDYAQCHFFAGIGGWSLALQLAGWPDDVPVWTGSCPCQPLSCAGQRKGEMDERHLWPDFYRLIAECRPATLFGEQVASNDGLEWLDGISLDLEELDYAFAAADLPAACVGAPHGRQRFWWVASNTYGDERYGRHRAMQMRRRNGASSLAGTVLAARTEWTAESKPVALAYGVSERLANVRGYGNAIVPQVAAKIIEAYLATESAATPQE